MSAGIIGNRFTKEISNIIILVSPEKRQDCIPIPFGQLIVNHVIVIVKNRFPMSIAFANLIATVVRLNKISPLIEIFCRCTK